MLMTSPSQRAELEIDIDYGQVYVFDPESGDAPGSDSMTEALNEAMRTGRHVTSRGGLIDLLVPVQWHKNAPMLVEKWETEPPDDDGWDEVVDVDLDVPSG